MGKITFRADDDLVEELEAFDASKSEVMREALREYLDDESDAGADEESSDRRAPGSLDDLVAERVDAIVAERVDEALDRRLSALGLGRDVPRRARPRRPRSEPRDVNVNVTLDGATLRSDDETADATEATTDEPTDRKTRGGDDSDPSDERRDCGQCGEALDPDHVHCPNCGEKASRRVFCDCGDEVRTDWAFCPGCGRRTPAADVLDPS